MKKIKDFSNKSDFFAYLVKNKKELIDIKKTTIKHADVFMISESGMTSKSLLTNHKDDLSTGIIKRSIIGNTYNWLDSHGDVHLDNIFDKSIKERGVEKIWHLHDHEQKITAKVGNPSAIAEKSVTWKDLGVNASGETMVLVMDSNIRKDYNPLVYDMYLGEEIDQHSVGMRYIKIDLGINDPLQKEEYAVWQKVIDRLGNKERAIAEGFFWAVKEASLIEISAVLAGSNELTPTVENESKLLTAEPIEKQVEEMDETQLKSLYKKLEERKKEIEEKNKPKGIDYGFLVKNL